MIIKKWVLEKHLALDDFQVIGDKTRNGLMPIFVRNLKKIIIIDEEMYKNTRKVVDSKNSRIIKNARSSKCIPAISVIFNYYLDLEKALIKDIKKIDKETK